MTMNPLPPQAYTKETLLKAYHWVQSQPASIREMAITPDILVSLYLKASRDGSQSLENPSIQNFKSELRSLAGMMGELDAKPTPPGVRTPPNHAPSAQTIQKNVGLNASMAASFVSSPLGPLPDSEPIFLSNPRFQSNSLQDSKPSELPQKSTDEFTPSMSQSISQHEGHQVSPQRRLAPEVPRSHDPQDGLNQSSAHSPSNNLVLDARSFELVQETKKDFNLSTDQEALRMLIQIGASKAKQLLKN